MHNGEVRSHVFFFPKSLNGIRWNVVFGLLTPSSLVQNSEELITRRNPCGLYNSWRCWELNCDRLALPVCMPWSQIRAVVLLFLGYPFNSKLGGSRAVLDMLEKRQIFWACYNSNTGGSVPYPSQRVALRLSLSGSTSRSLEATESRLWKSLQ